MLPPDLQAKITQASFICGSDEAGTGAWAGPFFVCATVVPRTWAYTGVTDSKKLTPGAREKLYPVLVSTVTHCLIEVGVEELDREGLGKALTSAHSRAIQGALAAHKALGHTEPPLVIIDGSRGLPGAIALPKADFLIPAVSAASILAKVSRDRVMRELDLKFPGYGWADNAGYGAPKHQEALKRLGVSPVHRLSYSPMSNMVRTKASEPKELWLTFDDS